MEISFKEQCIVLRRKGYSVNEIMRITGRAKTSIYTHIQGIPLTAKRIAQYRRECGLRIRQFALARKGKSTRSFKEFQKWTPETVLLVSHLLFDGELMRGKCSYNNRSRSLLLRVERLMKMIYDFEPKRIRDHHTGVTRLAYYNVALSDFLFKKSQSLLKEINRHPLSHKREFLRAFFDDEGCITFLSTRKRQVRGYQKDVALLQTVKTLLSDFSIQSSIKAPNEVLISGKSNLLKFREEINFSPGVRINGNRSNSVWKKSLEKRELLDRAIQSFKS
jgi:hypothetical protein